MPLVKARSRGGHRRRARSSTARSGRSRLSGWRSWRRSTLTAGSRWNRPLRC